jgi:hypothetical protein
MTTIVTTITALFTTSTGYSVELSMRRNFRDECMRYLDRSSLKHQKKVTMDLLDVRRCCARAAPFAAVSPPRFHTAAH